MFIPQQHRLSLKISFFTILILLISACQPDARYTAFVECLEGKGVTMYGTFWSNECREQKLMFNGSSIELPYIECDIRSGQSLTESCFSKKIDNFPTWEIPEKGLVHGIQTLEKLSELSGCPLPE